MLMSTLAKHFSDYIAEKQGCKVLENEYGFVVYLIKEGGNLHIANMYVAPEFRNQRKGSTLMDMVIEKVAPENNCDLITANCDLSQMNPELSMKAILGYNYNNQKRFKILPETRVVNFYMELK